MKYKILNSKSTDSFEELVESHIKDGWELQGGVSTGFKDTDVGANYKGGIPKFKPYLIFYQAVTKRKTKKEF